MAREFLPALLSALGVGIGGYERTRASNAMAEQEAAERERERAERKQDREQDRRRQALMMLTSGIHDETVLGKPSDERVTVPEDLRQAFAGDAIRGGAIDLAPTVRGADGMVAGQAPRTDSSDFNTRRRFESRGEGFSRDVTTEPSFRREEQLASERRAVQLAERERARERAEVAETQGKDAESLATAAQAAGATPQEVAAIRAAGRTAGPIYSSVMSRVQGDRSAARSARRPDPLLIGGRPFTMRDGKLVATPMEGTDGKPITGPLSNANVKPETINAFTGRAARELAEFNSLDEAYKNLETAYNSPPNGVTDLGMVIALAKMLDPASVVREGEVTVVRSTSGIPGWLFGAYNTLQRAGGGTTRMLDNATRENIYNMARAKAEQSSGSIDSRMRVLERQGQQMGIPNPRELIFHPFSGTELDPELAADSEPEDLAGYIDMFGEQPGVSGVPRGGRRITDVFGGGR